jgi:hypothetical protein
MRLVASALHPAGADQARVDRLAGRGHHQVGHRHGLHIRGLGIQQFQLSHRGGGEPADGLHLPQARVALLGGTARWQHTHLVALADGPLR